MATGPTRHVVQRRAGHEALAALALHSASGSGRWHDDHVTRSLIAHGELVVVETEDEAFLGTAELTAAGIVVRTGYRGHPVLIAAQDVVSISPASEALDET